MPSTMVLLVIAGVIMLLGAAYLVYLALNKPKTDNFLEMLATESYNIEFPPECAEYDKVKASSASAAELKKALLKRALANIPVRNYMQAEERNIQRLYQQSMVSQATWKSFQEALTLVVEEVEFVTAEAEEIEEKWGERIWMEAQFFFEHFTNKKRQQDDHARQEKMEKDALKKAKKDEKNKEIKQKREEEMKKEQAERAEEELMKMLDGEDKKKPAGLTKRKSSKKKAKK